MTGRRPICPECRSDQIVPDVTNGGAGRNRCAVCNHVSAVRDFYPEPSPADPMPWIGKNERRLPVFNNLNSRYGKFYQPGVADAITERAREITAEAYKTLYLQDPVNFPIPEGYEWDNKTGTIKLITQTRAAVTDTPAPRHKPAPIRQYKDD